MKSTEVLKELEKQVVFNSRTVRNIVAKPAPYANLFIHRLRKNGAIYEIEKGKYTLHKDPLLISSRIIWPSYISLWSALRYHNLTEQIPHSVWVITTRLRRKIRMNFLDTEINFVITKPKYFFGYDKLSFRGYEIFVADPEKAIIDCLLFRKVSSAEIFGILKNNMGKIRQKKLVGYAVRTENHALIKRLGYMLGKLGIDTYNRVRKYVYYPSTRIEQNMPMKGPLNEKWRILENVKL